MNDLLSLEFRELMAAAAHIHREGTPAQPAAHRQLACVWGRDPGTGRLDCHWVTEPPRH